MWKEEVEDAPNVVTGTFSILTQLVDVLFDSGAMHSFIYVKLVETRGLVPTYKSSLLSVIFPNGKTVRCEELHENCHIQMYEHKVLVNLYRFELTDFRVILGMD